MKLRTTYRRLVLGLAIPVKRLSTAIGRFIQVIRLQDTANTNDSAALDVGKSLLDEATAVDEVASKDTIRALSDKIAFTDGSEAYFLEDYVVGAPDNQTYTLSLEFFIEVGKNVSDAAFAADQYSASFAQSSSDEAQATDQDMLEVGKNLADSASSLDRATKSIDKIIADSVIMQEQIGKLFERSLASNIGASDSDQPYFLEDYVEGAPTAQTYTLTGQFIKAFETPKAESVVASEELGGGATIGDLPTYLFIKALGNTIPVSETASLTLQRGLAHTTNVADTGSLISQNYVDNETYFAENYVGDSRTF